MKEEGFNPEDYAAEDRILLEDPYDENDVLEFEWSIDLPYGAITEMKLQYRKPADEMEEANDEQKYHDVHETIKDAFYWFVEPKPISVEEQK